jgi:glutamate N-acetyltransferase/amino-acid N-acetyltransferase
MAEAVRDSPVPVPGFRFAGIAAGIKKNGNPDLALLAADGGAAIAGVYTKNRVIAAPVIVAKERARKGRARAVLVNSGCANACTGAPGLEAARRSCAAVAEALGCDAKEIVPASTGVIGALLPAEKIEAAAASLAAALSEGGAADFARAIMTTDQWPKVASTEAGAATVLGIAKGAGMIHPDLATTLAFVATDAAATPSQLRKVLASSVGATFNCISVDGDTSTNDTILLLASGRAKVTEKELEAAVRGVLGALGESIVRDGEGAKHVARIEVSGVANDAQARAIARTIATSPLVKTALHGRDANWGRILAAAGRAGVAFDPSRAEIRIEDEVIVRGGTPVGREAEERAAQHLRGARYTIGVSLGRGKGRAFYLTCDLGPDYVAVNANYRS